MGTLKGETLPCKESKLVEVSFSKFQFYTSPRLLGCRAKRSKLKIRKNSFVKDSHPVEVHRSSKVRPTFSSSHRDVDWVRLKYSLPCSSLNDEK